jgi:hypothetical protein
MHAEDFSHLIVLLWFDIFFMDQKQKFLSQKNIHFLSWGRCGPLEGRCGPQEGRCGPLEGHWGRYGGAAEALQGAGCLWLSNACTYF